MKHLKELRKAAKMTQSELGKIVNVSTSTIASYENGRRLPDAKMVLTLAKYFGVTADYILDMTEIPYHVEAEDSLELRMLRDLYKLPAQMRETYINLLNDYLELCRLRDAASDKN